jgi:hypothetical protein
MLFKLGSVCRLLAMSSFSNAVALNNRQADSNITLFVYGSDVNGAPLFYADGKLIARCEINSQPQTILTCALGKAYFGLNPVNEITGTQTNVTVATSGDTTTPWSVAANSSTVSFNETLYMALNPITTSQIEFTPANNMTADYVNTGLAWFGTSVAYAADESNYQLSFAGLATNTSGVYALYFVVGTDSIDGSFPVSVKSTAPVLT